MEGTGERGGNGGERGEVEREGGSLSLLFVSSDTH